MAKKQWMRKMAVPTQTPEFGDKDLREFKQTFKLLAELIRGLSASTDEVTCGMITGLYVYARAAEDKTIFANDARWRETLSVVGQEQEDDPTQFARDVGNLRADIDMSSSFGVGVAIAWMTAANVEKMSDSDTITGTNVDEDDVPPLGDDILDAAAVSAGQPTDDEQTRPPMFEELRQMLSIGCVTEINLRINQGKLVATSRIPANTRLDDIVLVARTMENLMGGVAALGSSGSEGLTLTIALP